jgi:hypothetical protein
MIQDHVLPESESRVAAAPGLLLVTEDSTGNLNSIDCSGKVSLLAMIPAPRVQNQASV